MVCYGRYADATSRSLLRSSSFHSLGAFNSTSFRRALFFGSTPPHQATLFGVGARNCLSRYASGYRLSADLDYFLRISSFPGLCVRSLDVEFVHMAVGGVSVNTPIVAGKSDAYRLHFNCNFFLS